MKARTRKQTHAPRTQGPSVRVQALMVVAALVVVASADLFERARIRNEIVDIAYHMRQNKRDLIDQRNINGKLLSRVSELRALTYVKTKLEEQGVVLTQPELERVVYLTLPKVPAELLKQALPPAITPPQTPLKSLLVSRNNMH